MPTTRPISSGTVRLSRPITRSRADTLLGGPLAHPVEQGTFNPKVARSRLARPTRKSAHRILAAAVATLNKRLIGFWRFTQELAQPG